MGASLVEAKRPEKPLMMPGIKNPGTFIRVQPHQCGMQDLLWLPVGRVGKTSDGKSETQLPIYIVVRFRY